MMAAGFCSTASAEALLRRYGLADETQVAVLLSSELFQGKTEHDVCNLVANLAHETGNFRYTREIADGERYNGRLDLGNTEPGDGPRFKGRGLIQLTGRYNYVMFQKYLVEAGGDLATLDIVSDPELVANDPRLCALTVVFFLRNKWTSGMSVVTLRRRINGGLNGLGDTLTKYLDALADDDARSIAIEREKAEYEQETLLVNEVSATSFTALVMLSTVLSVWRIYSVDSVLNLLMASSATTRRQRFALSNSGGGSLRTAKSVRPHGPR
jgi:predicted chitinase